MRTYLIQTSTTEHLTKGTLASSLKLSLHLSPRCHTTRQRKGFEIIFPDLNQDGKRYFPDGEIYIGITKANKLKNKRVIVLHSGAPKPNEGVVELELILQILRDNKVRPEVFFTYFPYGMQDEVFKKRETNVAESLIKKLINFYKVKKIYVIDPHFGGRKWAEKYPIENISAVPILVKKVREDFGENIIFLSPDIGGQRRTGILAGLKKERLNSFNVEMFSRKLNLKGKIVGVVDDIIKTGGTLLKFREIVKKAKVKKVIALVTHGVIPLGVVKVKKKYSQLYLTNTVKQKGSNIDITNLILNTIKKHGRD